LGGFSSADSAQLLGLPPSAIEKYTRSAVVRLARLNRYKEEQMDHQNVEHRTIEHLAYQLWLERGRPDGSPDEDWFLAGRELGKDRVDKTSTSGQATPSSTDATPISDEGLILTIHMLRLCSVKSVAEAQSENWVSCIARAFCRAAKAGGALVCGVMTAVGADPKAGMKYAKTSARRRRLSSPSSSTSLACTVPPSFSATPTRRASLATSCHC